MIDEVQVIRKISGCEATIVTLAPDPMFGE
jgi:hypothetical protein